MLNSFQVLLLIAGTLLFYLSNKNQQLLPNKLSDGFRVASYLTLLCAYGFIFSQMKGPSVIFQSIIVVMLGLMIAPFVALLMSNKRGKS
ncbi:hypothetical protein CWB99_03125 [Pseudoalteromonas rubra]|uniref:DUF3325 domain-containing protein n=1 Tax=Pseudoalteromonas rubra TaxID=43658 RepID=A0A5S3WS05_9GAMM|nr:hypothetical protein [Pseudoalteromonas rubra]TMP30164.1 hypothetical protein CWC00_17360 [Pseudoalteromonas rubra]TMP31968.1 hypothetical protein CWB99_03125 [Pseudoalteromonas rubra]